MVKRACGDVVVVVHVHAGAVLGLDSGRVDPAGPVDGMVSGGPRTVAELVLQGLGDRPIGVVNGIVRAGSLGAARPHVDPEFVPRGPPRCFLGDRRAADAGFAEIDRETAPP